MLTVYEKELSPELRLWLSVLCLCIKDVLRPDDNGSCPKTAYEFINDTSNKFYIWIAEYLGYEPERLTERIVKGIRRIESHRGTLNDKHD